MTGKRADGAIVRQLRNLFDLGPIGDLTDGQLLERFATDQGEGAELAFAALVERHQGLVWRACLAIVRDRHRAEDAFQATFLVLARRGRSLWVRDSLGPWLHQVACRTASCLRAAARRRLDLERRAADRAGCSIMPPPRDFDLEAAVHEAVDQLPSKYRAPIVLCDLEGRTHAEAARALGWPIGTVKSRQSAGRRLIRDRLVRHGLPVLGAVAAVESLGRAAVAALPRAASRGVVAAALGQSAGAGAGLGVSGSVLALARGAGWSLAWTALRPLAAATLALGVGAGTVGVSLQNPAGPVVPGVPQVPAAGAGPVPTALVEDPEIKAKLRAQELATRRTRLNYEIATLTREVAQITVTEYDEAIYPHDLATSDGAIALARSDLQRAEDRVAWSSKMYEKGYVSKATKVADELTLARAKFELEQGETQKQVLIKYTRDKQRKSLQSDVARAEANEATTKAAWENERDKLAALERQLRPAPR